MIYHQCKFSQKTKDGMRETVGWINSRGAIPGAKVELKGESGLWTVESVGHPGVEEVALKDNQKIIKAFLKSKVPKK